MYLFKKSFLVSRRFLASLCMLAVLFSSVYIPPMAAEAGSPVPTTVFTIKDSSGKTIKTYSSRADLEAAYSSKKTIKNYSALDSMEPPRQYIYSAEGVSLYDLVDGAGYDCSTVTKIVTVSTDKMSIPLTDPFVPSNVAYYYPNLFTGSQDGAVAVTPMLAFRAYFNQSTSTPQVVDFNESNSLLLCVGQKTFTSVNRNQFNKCVEEIQITGNLKAPVLAADNTDNTIGNNIDLTFTDATGWKDTAGLQVSIDNGPALASDKYTFSDGHLIIDKSVFATAKSYAIKITATGYDDATVTQEIKAVGAASASADIKSTYITYGSTIQALIKTVGLTAMKIEIKSEDNTRTVDSQNITDAGSFPTYSYQFKLPSDITAGSYKLVVSSSGMTLDEERFTVKVPKDITITCDGKTTVLTYQQLLALPSVQRNYSTMDDNEQTRKTYITKGVELTALLQAAGISINDVQKIKITPSDNATKAKEFTGSDLLAVRNFYPTTGSDDGKVQVTPMIALLENKGTDVSGMYADNAPRFFIGQLSSASNDRTGDSCLKFASDINVELKSSIADISITSPAVGDQIKPGSSVTVAGTASTSAVAIKINGPSGASSKEIVKNDNVVVTNNKYSANLLIPVGTAEGDYTVTVNGIGNTSVATAAIKLSNTAQVSGTIAISSPVSDGTDKVGPGGRLYIEGTAVKLSTISAIITGPNGPNSKEIYRNNSAPVAAGDKFSIKMDLPVEVADGNYTVTVNGNGAIAPATAIFKVQSITEIMFKVNGKSAGLISIADLNNPAKFKTWDLSYSTPDCVDAPAPAVDMVTKGVLLKDVVNKVLSENGGYNNYDSIKFTAIDNYGKTWTKLSLVDTPRYYFPKYKVVTPGGTSDGAILIEPSLALSEKWVRENDKNPETIMMTSALAPRLYMGETAYGQQTTGFHIKSVCTIDIIGARKDAKAGEGVASGSAVTVLAADSIGTGARLLIDKDALATKTGDKIKVGGADKNLASFNIAGASVNLTQDQSVGDKKVKVEKAVQLHSATSDIPIKSSGSNIVATLANDTTVLAPLGWDGTITPPVVKTTSVSDVAPSGFKFGNTVIEVGNPDQVLLFDKPVVITLPGVAATNFCYKATGSSTWTPMVKATGTYANPAAPAFPGEAYITDGTNTKIITWHMTQFANLTANSTSAPSTGGGPSGGGGPTVETGTATLTPAKGGKVELSGSIKLDVPANALIGSSDVKLALAKTSGYSTTPENMTKLGDAYSVKVGSDDAYAFAKPTTLTMNFKTTDLPTGSALNIFAYDSKISKWSKVDSKVSGSTVTAEVDKGGIFALFCAKAADTAVVPAVIPASTLALNDISSHWAKDAIEKMAASGIVSGYSDGSFKPNKVVTRAEFAAMLVKVNNLPVTSGKVFSDTTNSWAKDYIATAYAAGIVKGLNDNYFGADQPITREQMAVMVNKVADLKGTDAKVSFKDEKKISSWSKAFVTIAVQNDLMKGYPDGSINPQGKTTRAEAVSVIAKIVK